MANRRMKQPAQFHNLDTVRLPGKPLHLAIGMFDGVHVGHQSVIDSAVRAARAAGGLAGILTFWPHPSEMFRPDDPTPQIMSPTIKEKVLARRNIDFIVTQPFTRDFASISAEDFLPEIQRRLQGLAGVYVGENWRFGKDRRGDVAMLVREGEKHRIAIVSVPRLHVNGEPVSSTRIRDFLTDGQIESANFLLGYPYFAEGLVQTGKGLGHQIGFPTLNIHWQPGLQPRYGVYAARVRLADSATFHPAVANYGLRPTLGQAKVPLLESHLLTPRCPIDCDDEIHVEWLRFLRPEERFRDIAELRAQIARDKDEAARYFKTS